MENITRVKQKNRRAAHDLLEVFQCSFPRELNIYGQAHLENMYPLKILSNSQELMSSELGATFQLSGDIEGHITCLIDTYNKKVIETELPFFRSLFIESMNIFAGQFVTNIENKFEVQTLISNPLSIEKNIISKENNNILFSGSYKFVSIHDEFDCRILIDLKKE